MQYKDIFPYPFDNTERSRLQIEFMDRWTSCLENKKGIMAHAPTGIGKTICSLAPAIANMGNKKIVILVSRVSQHEMFIKELKKISKKRPSLSVVDIVGKDKMCPINDGVEEKNKIKDIRAYCDRLKEAKKEYGTKGCKYLEKLNLDKDKLLSILRDNILSYSEVIELCKEKGVCPYELLNIYMKISANVIITDYGNILRPKLREIFLKKLDVTIDEIILIVDEAHNIPETVRNYLSKTMDTLRIFGKKDDKFIKSVAYEIEYYINRDIHKRKDGIIDMDDSLKRLQDRLICIEFDGLTNKFYEIKEKMEKKINNNKKGIKFKKKDLIEIFESVFIGNLDDIISDMGVLITRAEPDDRKGLYLTKLKELMIELRDMDEVMHLLYGSYEWNDKNKEWRNKISCSCLDPSILTKIFNNTYSTLLMSGTFRFFEMQKTVLGLDDSFDEPLEQQSPFPKENRLYMISDYACSKGRQGCNIKEENAEKYARMIVELLKIIPKNVGVFSSSYSYNRKIEVNIKKIMNSETLNHSNFKKLFIEISSKNSRKGEKERVIEIFKKEAGTEQGGVLLAVAGGSYCEGIDYLGDYMNAVIIVGVPLAQWGKFSESLIKYYDKIQLGKGRAYGYNLPAMNKVMQASGRCIRSDNDKGVIIYIDPRFTKKQERYRDGYRLDLPKDAIVYSGSTGKLIEKVNEFFKSDK